MLHSCTLCVKIYTLHIHKIYWVKAHKNEGKILLQRRSNKYQYFICLFAKYKNKQSFILSNKYNEKNKFGTKTTVCHFINTTTENQTTQTQLSSLYSGIILPPSGQQSLFYFCFTVYVLDMKILHLTKDKIVYR